MIDKLYEIAQLENDNSKDIYSKIIDRFPEKIDPENFSLLIIKIKESNNSLKFKGVSKIGIN
ncbi:MAG: hypothetical protein ABIG89_01845, partial [Candidatus Woesearchaeota archaeon]